jgi:hypothetical protein
VIDGDTLEIQGNRIRLWGIDAPESINGNTAASMAMTTSRFSSNMCQRGSGPAGNHLFREVGHTGSNGGMSETKAFVRDPDLLARLAQWPVAVVLSEVYRIEGEPLLMTIWAFRIEPFSPIPMTASFATISACNISGNRFVIVLSHGGGMSSPLPGFYDPGKVQMYGSSYPRVPASSSEGKRIWKEMQIKERDRTLFRAVKGQNRARNNGVLICGL